jgi:asparagine synthase (glutamine-hydrolysing)
MCGICGILNLDSAVPVEHETLQKMCDIIQHRGPDDEGFFVQRNVGLGMRRLSIIDLSGGHQPVFNETRAACIVLNGEIYNYLDLRRTLEKLGHRFYTHSDTEAVIHAYEEWGEACPKQLRGMFAFAIWDQAKEKLFIARDRLGKKPVYYYQDDRRFIFASEIKAILQNQAIPRRLDLQALDTYLSLGYVPAPRTMFDRIFKLPAGHCLSFAGGHSSIQAYWDLEFGHEKPLRLAESLEQVRDLLKESVRIRLMSDVPLGAFLSGGIDSGMVVGLMSQMMNRPVDTFSVGFEEKEHNELPYARIVSQHLATRHHEIQVNTCSPELFEKLVWHQDEPVADPAAVPTMLVSELARQYVTVVLTGEGGDELFAGYDYYATDRWARRYEILPARLNRQVLPALARGANHLLGRPRYHERTIWYWSLPPGAQMMAWVAIFTDAQKSRLYHPAFPRQIENGAGQVFADLYHQCETRDALHRLLYIDTKVWLPDDLLMKVDKMSMANSLEARAPYLDHRLIEFMATVPSSLKSNGATPKFILKELAKEILPPEIVYRKKHTFDVPIEKWLKGSLRDLTLDLVQHGVVEGATLFDKQYILGDLWQGLEKDWPGYARQLWSLVNLGLWARKFSVQL